MDKYPRGVAGELPVRAHGASVVEDWFHLLRARIARRRGHREHIVPLTGYGTTESVRILCRVLLLKSRPTITGAPRKVRGWRSFLGAPVAGATVTLEANGHTLTLTADRGGVVDTVVSLSLSPGWHAFALTSVDSLQVKVKVFVVAASTTTGIICDVDDTVMVTALPRPLLAAWNSFVRDENARRPVPGMAVLLERLTKAYPDAPVIYLSTGAWSVAPTLSRFLSRHLYPLGAFLLTDWGPTHDRWFRSGPEHKRTNLHRLAQELRGVKWILIGDDGQHDEALYGEFVVAYPEHVQAVAIRELLTPEALLAGGRTHLDRTHNPSEVPWLSAPNGAGLAAGFAQLGLL